MSVFGEILEISFFWNFVNFIENFANFVNFTIIGNFGNFMGNFINFAWMGKCKDFAFVGYCKFSFYGNFFNITFMGNLVNFLFKGNYCIYSRIRSACCNASFYSNNFVLIKNVLQISFSVFLENFLQFLFLCTIILNFCSYKKIYQYCWYNFLWMEINWLFLNFNLPFV